MSTPPPVRVVLAIFRLTPLGGLEQVCLRVAQLLAERGCAVTLLTTRPPQTPPSYAGVETAPPRGHSNHGRLAAFAADAARAAAGRFDVTVAFHAIPGFDVIFCADPSRSRPGPLKRWLPRYRAYARLEREAFAPGRLGRALLLARPQLEGFVANAGAPRERLTLLPPSLDPARVAPPTAEQRAAARAALQLRDSVAWLWIGLYPRTKGLDRVLRALASAPEARLLVCGLDRGSDAGRRMGALADRLGVAERVAWLGYLDRAGLAGALAAADVFVHPARADVTGMVILEALANGVPVVTTQVCGFAEHVISADAGAVLPEPFRDADLAVALAAAPPQLAGWSAKALAYARSADLYSGLDVAAGLILAARPGP